MIVETAIETERLTLRTLTDADACGAYLRWMNDPQVTRFLESRFRAFTQDDLKSFIHSCNEDEDVLLLGIFVREGQRHIGNLKIGPFDHHHQLGDMGIAIGDPTVWGKGYAREAIAAAADFAFKVVGLHKITAGIYASNTGSHRAFLAAGFVEEGRRRDHYRFDGRWEDALLMGRLAPSA
jgi:RimJ/RimL family protein N-acetyltransferase